jgi:hypothetical protein
MIPQDVRTTSLVSRRWIRGSLRSPFTRDNTNSVASFPISRIGWAMVVNGG